MEESELSKRFAWDPDRIEAFYEGYLSYRGSTDSKVPVHTPKSWASLSPAAYGHEALKERLQASGHAAYIDNEL